MDAKPYDVMLADAETRLKRLRALYDQWFAGIERIEPAQQKKELDSLLGQLRRDQPRNTALRFRFQQVVQRYTTYNTYWRRIARQIEDGTYKRDVLRARRLAELVPSEPPPSSSAERAAGDPTTSAPPARKDVHQLDDVDVDIDAALAALRTEPPPPAGPKSVPPPAPPARAPSSYPPGMVPAISPFALPKDPLAGEPARSFPAPNGLKPAPGPIVRIAGGNRPAPLLSGRPSAVPPPLPPARPPALAARPPVGSGAAAPSAGTGLGDDQMQRIYERYVEARRNNAERADVKFEAVANTVRAMMPKLRQKHAGKQIDFEVVVKDGKVALKPVAR